MCNERVGRLRRTLGPAGGPGLAEFGAWPFTAEWLSATFDYNVAPFFQSFVEIRVERSANRMRLIPYGVHGRLTWGELATSDGLRAAGAADRTPAEWVVPMTR